MFQVLRETAWQPRILSAAKLYFKSEWETDFLKQKVREFGDSRPAMQEMLKEVPWREGKLITWHH